MGLDPGGGIWNADSLLAHILSIIDANDHRYDQRFCDAQSAGYAALAAAKEAVGKSEAAMERRFASVNEFRATLADQQKTLATKTEMNLLVHGLELRVQKLESAVTIQSGRQAGARDSYGWIIGAVGILIALLTLALRFIKVPS